MKKTLIILTIVLMAIILGYIVTGNVNAARIPHHGSDADPNDIEDCIACHDGTIGNHVSYCTVECDFSTPHVIYKFYPDHKRNQYRPIASVLAQGVKLPKNQVVCISCHDITNSRKDHIVVERDLCLICHIK